MFGQTHHACKMCKYVNAEGPEVSVTVKQEAIVGVHRSISRPLVKAFGFGVSLMFFLVLGRAAAQNEWLTWGHDPERTGSNPDERVLNKDNVFQLEVKWTAQISTAPKEYVLSTMTAPVVTTVNTCLLYTS